LRKDPAETGKASQEHAMGWTLVGWKHKFRRQPFPG
jgi:hypothetical protein